MLNIFKYLLIKKLLPKRLMLQSSLITLLLLDFLTPYIFLLDKGGYPDLRANFLFY